MGMSGLGHLISLAGLELSKLGAFCTNSYDPPWVMAHGKSEGAKATLHEEVI